ncbi:N-glycosylase/DNA lyase [Amia ocellicauda]|uniref:N-glycosylase/DNA lyase n=1 Tax=Amia ocellicauda TaxID=2972642 RepID=UPI0034648F4E
MLRLLGPVGVSSGMSQHAVLSEGGAAWRWLPCTHSELRLDLTLGCGQSFRWTETSKGHWTGVMGGRVWTLTQTADRLWFHRYSTQPGPREGSEVVTPEHEEEEDGKDEEALRDYFQLKVQLGGLYQGWGAVDPHFKHTALSFPGVRMLRQDPTECLFSFICSSNNHVSRIQGMVGRLCQRLGEPLCQLGTETYHTFPSLHRLAEEGVEECLRALGFGYRARFLHQSACHILDMKGPDWLASLRGVAYPEARSALCALPGVGLKVADCVCLMSLDKLGVVPVDTHVWQIARRHYLPELGSAQRSLTPALNQRIGDFFRQLWGPYAGWAHSVLFCADLKKFQKLKVEKPSSEEEVKKEGGREEEVKKEKGRKRRSEGDVKTGRGREKQSKGEVKTERGSEGQNETKRVKEIRVTKVKKERESE